MVHLRLIGVTEDGRHLRLVSDAKVEFTVDVDDRLRAALSGEGSTQTTAEGGDDQARLGQWETRMESTLRPRDIQARIRSGETPESVAQVAGTSVDKVMPYAAPVLAERAHVAQRAQRASIRRRPPEGGATSTARTLGDAVGSHLRARNVDPETVAWDAWRREDGRWTLTGSYTTTGRVGAAHFSFDAPGNYVVADDDDAHWLLGEVADGATGRRRVDPARPRRPLRRTPAPAVRRTRGRAPARRGRDRAGQRGPGARRSPATGPRRPPRSVPRRRWRPTSTPSPTPRQLPRRTRRSPRRAGDETEEGSEDDPRRHEPPSRKPVKKTRGRASVPSWDEIMFGGDGDA